MPERPEDDLLSSILNAYQLRAGVYGHPQLCGVWQVGASGHRRAAFHLVGRGACWLHLRGTGAPQALQGGDLVMLPHDAWHMLTGTPELQGDENVMPAGGDGPFTTPVCGYFAFQAGDKNPILDALPEVIVVRREDTGRRLEVIGRLLIEEAQAERVGYETEASFRRAFKRIHGVRPGSIRRAGQYLSAHRRGRRPDGGRCTCSGHPPMRPTCGCRAACRRRA